MTGNAAGMTVRAGCYFKFGMSIPLAKVPFLRHFGGDRGAPGAEVAAGVGVTPVAGGDDVVKASWDRSPPGAGPKIKYTSLRLKA